MPYSLPFEVSGACARNCSFVSGEAAGIATLGLVFGVLAWRSCSGRDRVLLLVAAPAVLAGGLRIAMGRHFLSDVVFAWLLSALVVAALYPLFGTGAVRHRFSAANVAQDLRIGLEAVRRRTWVWLSRS